MPGWLQIGSSGSICWQVAHVVSMSVCLYGYQQPQPYQYLQANHCRAPHPKLKSDVQLTRQELRKSDMYNHDTHS